MTRRLMRMGGISVLGLLVLLGGVVSCQSGGVGGREKVELKRFEPVDDQLPVMTGEALPGLEPVDGMMRKLMAEHEIPGAAVAITRHGKLIYARGFGYADAATKEIVQPHALFRIASISKPITAVAILQLVDQGKLKLEDRVLDVLGLPGETGLKVADPRLREVTIGQCLRHTGGWNRGKSGDVMFKAVEIAHSLGVELPASAHDVIRYMLGVKLDSDPGTEYAYSNFGYALLGRVIEKVTGQGYEAYVKAHVLGPVGARGARLGRTLRKHRAEGEVVYHDPPSYGLGKSVFAESLGSPLPWSYGGWHFEAMDSHGAWICSAVDLVKFARDFDRPADSRLLKAGTIEMMFARPMDGAGYGPNGKAKERYYALGWSARQVAEAGGKANQWHGGLLSGTSTILVRRHDGVNWAILFNSRMTKAGKELSSIADPLMHQAVNDVKVWPAGEIGAFD